MFNSGIFPLIFCLWFKSADMEGMLSMKKRKPGLLLEWVRFYIIIFYYIFYYYLYYISIYNLPVSSGLITDLIAHLTSLRNLCAVAHATVSVWNAPDTMWSLDFAQMPS